ncbi:MAG TPA: nuclear transport factor 2 family protein [Solirubrobacteraceae bacterium]|nr:nuclear transport factor 2 family protein [Solirubrobacteraceae bacterium]
MKKVVHVAGKPFRFIGRLLLRSLRFLGKPFGKLGELRGKARIGAFAVVAVVVVAAVLVLKPGPDDSEQVSETLDRYAEATRDKDYQTICDDLYAEDLVERVRAAGLPCEVALRTGLEDRQNPRLEVLGVEVNGDQALARVRSTAGGEVPSTDLVRLVKEDGEWRVAALSEPGATLQTP